MPHLINLLLRGLVRGIETMKLVPSLDINGSPPSSYPHVSLGSEGVTEQK